MIQFNEKIDKNILVGGPKIWQGDKFTEPMLLIQSSLGYRFF